MEQKIKTKEEIEYGIKLRKLLAFPTLYLTSPTFRMSEDELKAHKEKERKEAVKREEKEKDVINLFRIDITETFFRRRVELRERETPLKDIVKIDIIYNYLKAKNIDLLTLSYGANAR